jgi:Protein of unknown function (DUF3891)
MIVTSHNQGWKIITQRSHGLLAAMLAFQFEIDLPNEIMVPTIIAIAEHDDGVAETKERKNLTDAGAPRHFLVDNGHVKTDLKQYQNVMELATSKSQINALLTSMHLSFIFSDHVNGKDKSMDNFLKDQEKNRKQLLKNLNFDNQFAEYLYRFVEWCDAFSLLICMDKIQPEGRKMDISENPDGVINQVFYKEDNVIAVIPWPFKLESFTIFYEYKIIEQLKFTSVEEFDKICKITVPQRQEFVLVK